MKRRRRHWRPCCEGLNMTSAVLANWRDKKKEKQKETEQKETERKAHLVADPAADEAAELALPWALQSESEDYVSIDEQKFRLAINQADSRGNRGSSSGTSAIYIPNKQHDQIQEKRKKKGMGKTPLLDHLPLLTQRWRRRRRKHRKKHRKQRQRWN
jgi:hypothetical protein